MLHLERLKNQKLPIIELGRDVTRHLKRGHRWIFADCFFDNEKMASGLYQLHYKKKVMGVGIVQADTQLRFRLILEESDPFFNKNNLVRSLNDTVLHLFHKAILLRSYFYLDSTRTKHNSFRLINGEGDGLPGLVVDVYNDTAVIKHDHSIMEEIWNKSECANAIVKACPFIKVVYFKRRNDDEIKGENLIGELQPEVIFKENNLFFATQIKDAAKTGFFLDQRDNRLLLSHFSAKKSMLNLFSYTGGFSLFGASGGASKVVSVDIAKHAIEASHRNFQINNIKTHHEGIAKDAFLFIKEAIEAKEKFDIVVTDPPSFAPNHKAIENATEAYMRVYADSLRLVSKEGLLVASSCSAHIGHAKFLDICRESFSKARKKGTLIYFGGQPFDHPYPLAMEELRYLKFALFRVD